MRYLGGKSRIAKEIAAVIAPKGPWWEPFCGGLSVSVQLAKYGPGLVSDACLPLISLYQAVRNGWEPPVAVSESDYCAARSFPDSDPRKAFVGFGCSFGGKWFAGYAKPVLDNGRMRVWSEEAARVTRRKVDGLRGVSLRCLSFFDEDPGTATTRPECIYADPPYAGTTGYIATGAFDHARFWRHCQDWANSGARVFVSEYACPVPADVVWEKHKPTTVGTGAAHLAPRTERLFRILPAQAQRVA